MSELKLRIKIFYYCIWLTIHSIVVFIVPGLPWLLPIIVQECWTFGVVVPIYIFIQVPIAIFAATKDNSIFERICRRIEDTYAEIKQLKNN